MSVPGRTRAPVRLIVLDLLGSILLAIGVYELLAEGGYLMPGALRFAGYEWVLILTGLVITLPAVFGIVNYARGTTHRGPDV